MISPISFTSTFKVSSRHNNFDKFMKFQQFSQEEEFEYNGAMKFKFVPDKNYPDCFEAECTLVASDNRDESVQDYCNRNGIVFKQIGHQDSVSIDTVEKRIYAPEQKGERLVKIDSQKLNELIKSQTSNIEDCEREYNLRYKDSVDFVLKSNDKFLTTKIVIFSNKGLTSDVLNHLWQTGELENNSLNVMFGNESYEPDQFMYFGLRDLGMRKVPVYTDEISYKILDALGIVKID